MTDDFIVDLKGYILREHRSPRDAWCDPDDVQAAIDKIERLKAALLEIVEECRNTGYGDAIVMERMIDRIEETARVALEGERTND